MTTFTWDGRTFATDTRRTTHSRDPADTDFVLHDDTNKIRVFDPSKPVMFEGHQVIVVSMLGCARAGDGAVKLLEAGEDLKAFYTLTAKAKLQPTGNSFHLAILTTNGLYEFGQHSHNQPTINHIGSTFAAMGSGAAIGSYLMRRFGVPANVAVAAASDVDKHTGGVITSVVVNDNWQLVEENGTPYRKDFYANREQVDDCVRKYATDRNARQKLLDDRIDWSKGPLVTPEVQAQAVAMLEGKTKRKPVKKAVKKSGVVKTAGYRPDPRHWLPTKQQLPPGKKTKKSTKK